METSACETLVTVKVKGAELSPGLAVYSFFTESHCKALGSAVGPGVAGTGTPAGGCWTGGNNTCAREELMAATANKEQHNDDRRHIRKRKIAATGQK